jgi:hypothetical protein
MKKELLFSLTKKDFIVEPFIDSGNGGQKRNKTMSCCRIKHPASGAVCEGKKERSFEQNKKDAFKRLVEKPEFQKWFKIQCAKAMGVWEDTEKWVENTMKKNNLKIEVVKDGKWTEVNFEEINYDELDD